MITETIAPSSIELTPEQSDATTNAIAFLKSGKDAEYRVGGYAGTGKTTVIKSIIKQAKMQISVAALSGKAVSVLRRKGIADAQTIHRTIYHFDPKTRESYRKASVSADAIIVDEASMVSRFLYEDIRAFGLPVLFVGDMGQLEPVGDDINLMDEDRLDCRLEKIHRQAEGNSIIEFATIARMDEEFGYGECDQVKIGNQSEFLRSLSWADQIIVGTNRLRHRINQRLRNNAGRKGKLCEGERVICVQNNKDFGVFNGMMMTVEKILSDDSQSIRANLTTEDGESRTNIPLYKESFGRDKAKDDRFQQHVVLCDYGYCITAHKAQGSEWDKVLVFEDCDMWNMRRWRYTAITRAAKELIYCF